jgi:hypothetical protein
VYKHIGYGLMLGDGPQTLTAMADSPVGMAAFLLDHDAKSVDLIARAFAGETTGLTRDDVLDNITLFWLTNTFVSAGQLYWENKHTFFGPKGVRVPVVLSVFPVESCIRRPAAGLRRRSPISSTTTSSIEAGTSPPGNSRNSS